MTPTAAPGPLAPLWVFGIAFGAIEAAVVVYLRALLGMEGDLIFPLRGELAPPQAHAMGVELAREAATLVLMLGPAWLYHPRPFLRFVAYSLVFGAWDLSYYGFLRVFLGWPAGPLTYDILFLLPTVWVAPVLCPALVALAMAAFAAVYLRLARRRPLRVPSRGYWLVAGAGGVLVLFSFMQHSGYYLEGGLPPRFGWGWFLLGYALALASGGAFLLSYGRERPQAEA